MRTAFVLLVLVFSPLALADAAPRTESELNQWVQQGRAAEAYQALVAEEAQRGEGSLDYLIGLAAMANQRDAEAVTRLERYVKRNPMQDPPRFALARALERTGRRDEAIEQYRAINARSPFPSSRERAASELARFEALPTVPVRDTEPEQEPPPKRAPEFTRPKRSLMAVTTLGGGYDSNANQGVNDDDRFFYFDLLQKEQQSAESPYASLGATAAYTQPFHQTWSAIAAAGGYARENPSAHFADSQSASGQAQLRWTGTTQRVTGGFIYSVGWIGDRESDHESAIALSLETLTPVVVLGVNVEGAHVRFPDASDRDVNSLYMRTSIDRAPSEGMRWLPSLVVYTGHEEEVLQGSPYGRGVWGLTAGLTRSIGSRLSADASVDVSQSDYNGFFTTSERRKDRRFGAGAFLHWTPGKESRWTFSTGGRYTRNISNEALFDFARTLVGIEVSASWGGKMDKRR